MNEKTLTPIIMTNKNWKEDSIPFISVYTSVYNRRDTLPRTMKSVDRQSFRDIEYIIVNNGSEEPLDDIIEQFMEATDLPVKYVKKQYGGAHTGYNTGIRNARGKLVTHIDSDDELLPNACEIFYNMWQSIPEEKRNEYATLRAQCVDINGKITGTLFLDDINEKPYEKVRKCFSLSQGEQHNCNVTKVLQKFYIPEPEGVALAELGALWGPVEYYYKSWGSNEVVRLYHTEGDDHATNFFFKRKESIQDCRDRLWNLGNRANHSEIFCINSYVYLRTILCYSLMYQILKKEDPMFIKKYPLTGTKNKFWAAVFWLPSLAGAAIYKKSRM